MADLDRDAVVVTNSRRFGTAGDKVIEREVNVTLTGQGTTTNKITAESMGFDFFRGLSVLVKTDDSVVVIGAPSNDGKTLLLKAAATNAPADYTGEYKCVIQGI